MSYKTKNLYKLYFKDGTSFESNGSEESSVLEFNIKSELNSIGQHIELTLLRINKSANDLSRIEYNLDIE